MSTLFYLEHICNKVTVYSLHNAGHKRCSVSRGMPFLKDKDKTIEHCHRGYRVARAKETQVPNPNKNSHANPPQLMLIPPSFSLFVLSILHCESNI